MKLIRLEDDDDSNVIDPHVQTILTSVNFTCQGLLVLFNLYVMYKTTCVYKMRELLTQAVVWLILIGQLTDSSADIHLAIVSSNR